MEAFFEKSLDENLNLARAPCDASSRRSLNEEGIGPGKQCMLKFKGQSFLQWLHSVCENSQACVGFQTFHRDWEVAQGIQDIKLH